MTYDRVLVPDPADRDFFPPQAFMAAMSAPMGIPPMFGLAHGNVRLLGKRQNYDDDYQALIDNLRAPMSDGVVEIISTFRHQSSGSLTIGAIDLGGFPVNPTALLWTYRAAARKQDLLAACIEHDEPLLRLNTDDLQFMASDAAQADGGINNDPRLPDLDGEFSHEDRRAALSQIARARVAAAIKAITYCTSEEIVPLLSSRAYGGLMESVSRRSASFIDVASDHDPYWTKRNQVLDLAYSEYLDDSLIEEMSVQDCLNFRTSNWGHHAEMRDDLLKSASEIARELADQPNFEERIREKLDEFRASAEALKNERHRLGFDVTCDLFQLGSQAGLSGLAAHAAGNLAQLQTALGSLTFLLTGIVLAVPKIKDWNQELQNLKAADQQFNAGTCLGIHNFFE